MVRMGGVRLGALAGLSVKVSRLGERRVVGCGAGADDFAWLGEITAGSEWRGFGDTLESALEKNVGDQSADNDHENREVDGQSAASRVVISVGHSRRVSRAQKVLLLANALVCRDQRMQAISICVAVSFKR